MANQVDSLNNLLKGELSAVQTYDMALKHAKTPNVISVLESSKDCHGKRVLKLSELVVSAGGTPTTESGAWGTFAKAVEGGAAILGESPAIGSLREGESHGLELYRSEMKHLEPPMLAVVQGELYPAQEKTDASLRDLP
jgi:hypothetical protein